MDRSWLSRAAASTQRLLSDSSHELPRWRSPSPMRGSMIPPPIVQSTYRHASPRPVTQSALEEAPSPLQDRQSELEADLQFLLDAQAEGLVRGFERGGGRHDDEQSSTGSTTPTVQSARRRVTRRVRKKPGLRSARKGIYNSILALSALKDTELEAISTDAQDNDDGLAQIDEWERKQHDLQRSIRHANDGSGEAIRAQRLRQEADALQEEINTVELQLNDMKARHRKLMKTVNECENSVQAKLASYTSSLSMLEQDVQRFLALEPTDEDSRLGLRDGRKTSVRQSRPRQRTLEMAREQYSSDREIIEAQRKSTEHEKKALDEGAAVWRDVVTQVTDFEKKLRTSMSSLSTSLLSSHSAWEDPPPQRQENSDQLGDLLQHLDTVLTTVSDKFNLAEERDWKLLIAAIGAELDALKQGRQLLSRLLPGVSSPSHQQENLVDTDEARTEAQTHDASATESSPRDHEEEGNEILKELDKSFETARPAARTIRSRPDDSSDEDPDELLFTRENVAEDE